MTRRILYCGNSDYVVSTFVIGTHAQTTGRFVETSKYLLGALETDHINQVTHIHGGTVMNDFPSSYAALREYDLLILSDIAADAILMYHPNRNIASN